MNPFSYFVLAFRDALYRNIFSPPEQWLAITSPALISLALGLYTIQDLQDFSRGGFSEGFHGVRFYARLLGKISQTAQLQIFTPNTTPTQILMPTPMTLRPFHGQTGSNIRTTGMATSRAFN